MKAVRTSRVLRSVSLVLITAVFCPLAQGRVITVDDDDQADFHRIQAGIDAASRGDVVSVAPGTYFENVTLRDGITLVGYGVEVTIIDANGYGDVVDARANDAAICGFTLRNSGESDLLHMNCGVYLKGNYAPVVRGNVIVGNRIGIGAWDGAHPDIRNNIIENNDDGLYLYGSNENPTDPYIVNNTIAGNQTNGILLREKVSPAIINNIITGHPTGINRNYVTGIPLLCYNNLWDNDVNYLRDGGADDTLAGPGSLSVDPCFARPGYWAGVNDPNVPVIDPNGQNTVWIPHDYHLKSRAGRYDPGRRTWVRDNTTSPCIDAGAPNSPVAFEPFPNGGTVNMGAYGSTAQASKSPSGRHAKYGGGTGEANDPYLIFTPEQMNAIGAEPNDWEEHFKLMADIDLSGFDGKEGRPAFNVIAPDTDPVKVFFQGTLFTGFFDGNGHMISHLTVEGGESLGLFGRLGSGARIKDLGVEDVNVSGSGDEVGGLVGYSEGDVARCYSTGKVRGRYSVGGLVGWNQRGTLIHCHSRAAVSARSHVGGLVAYHREGEVTQCYSTGAVSGEHDTGGLIGYGRSAVVTDSFWDTQTSGQATSAGGTGKTTAEMKMASTFINAGWDFVGEATNGTEDIWWINEGKDYPRLWWEARN